jgi:hypothetical protein
MDGVPADQNAIEEPAAETGDAPPPDAATEPGPESPLAAASPTGVAAVDAALERLRGVETAPLEDHVEIFDDVQRQLHDALAELDDEQ